jgi:hypothetical protein
MRKNLSLITYLLVIILLASCNRDNVQSTPLQTVIESEKTEFIIFELTSVSPYFDSYCGGEYGDKEAAADWVSIIESEYNISLKISSEYSSRKEGVLFNFSYQSSEYEYIKKGIEQGFISGLFYVNDAQILKKLIEDELVIPMNQLLADNKKWKEFPDNWKNAYSFDGSIWALPTRYENNTYLRQIRLDWLDALNMDMPETITDFYNVLYEFTYEDPNKDTIDNTSGAAHAGLRGVEDIFNSFDARLSISGNPGPVWNPNMNLWEDSVTKPEFKECLEFIIQCDSEGVFVNKEMGDYIEDFYSGYSGSFYSVCKFGNPKESIINSRSETGKANVGYIYGLSHIIDKNITSIFTNFSVPVFLTRNSINPKDTINIYVNIFLSDFNAYIMGRYGSPENISVIDDNTIAYKSINSEGEINVWPGIVSDSPKFQYNQVADYNTEIPESDQLKQRIIEEELGKNQLFYKYPWNDDFLNLSFNKERFLSSFGNTGNRIISDIINGKTSINDGLLEYEKYVSQYNIDEYISELNLIIYRHR